MKQNRILIGLIGLTALLLTLGVLWAVNRRTAEAPAYPDQQPALSAAADWLIANHQNEDGGYTSFSGGANLAPSDAGGSLDAILALVATGYDPAVVHPGHASAPLIYLQNNPDELLAYAASGGGAAAKAVLGLTAAAQNPRNFAGHDFAAALTSQFDGVGQYNTFSAYDQSLVFLALAAVDETADPAAVAWLKNQQAANGSWDDGFGTDSNSDATAMAIMGLLAQGEPANDPVLQNALAFIADSQLPTAGWEYGPGYGQNGNSTALVILALSSLGEDFYTVDSPWAQEGRTPLAALLSYQSDSGAFQADFGSGPFDDFFTTAQALPAVAGQSSP